MNSSNINAASSLALCLLLASSHEAGANAWNVEATYTFRTMFHMTPGTRYLIETTNLSPGADTVIHVLHGGFEHALADGCGQETARSCLTFEPRYAADFRIVVRAYATRYSGTADLKIQGRTHAAGIPVGGYVKHLSQLRVDDVLQTALLPAGSPDTYLYLLCNRFAGGPIIASDDDSGAGYASRIEYSRDGDCVDPAVVVSTFEPEQDGPTRLVHNDLGHQDLDGDGLGSDAEWALQTCDHSSLTLRNGYSCGTPASTLDTDGDGLLDRREVLGYREEQLLSRWGASPVHKDVFVEADWCADSCPANSSSPLTMPEITRAANLYSSGSNQYLENPDGQDGISLHVDAGNGFPATGAQTRFGDWGGAQCLLNTSASCQPEVGRVKGYEYARDNDMAVSRRGLFHYFRIVKQGGQSLGITADCFTAAPTASVWAHELGHNLGLFDGGSSAGNGGWGQCKPHYFSVMNYAYADRLLFSTGPYSGVPLHRTWVSESFGLGTGTRAPLAFLEADPFSYLVDDNGQIDWNRDGVFSGQVIANITWAWGKDCGTGTFQSQGPEPWPQSDSGDPSLTLLTSPSGNTYRYLFWNESGIQRYQRIRDFTQCTDGEECPPDLWEPASFLPATGPVSADSWSAAGVETLALATCTLDGRVQVRHLTLDARDEETWSAPEDLTVRNNCVGAVETLRWTEDRIQIYYRKASGRIGILGRIADGPWRNHGEARDLEGDPLVSEHIVTATVNEDESCGGQPCIYAIFVDPADHSLHAWRYDPSSRSWNNRDGALGIPGSFKSTHKVGFLYHRWSTSTQGRFWLTWRSHVSNELFASWTGAATLGASATLGKRTYHNHTWTQSLRGFDLMADGDKIRGADITTRLDDGKNPHVVVRVWQNVDGLYDWVVADSNDWPLLREGICASLAPASPCPTCLVVSPRGGATGADPEPTDANGNHHAL